MDRFTTHNGEVVDFKGDMDKLAEALLRLSEYEDTGLLPEEVAEVQKEFSRLDSSIDYLLSRCADLLNKRNSVEMISLRGENILLRAEAEKAKQEILDLKKQIEFLTVALEKKEDSEMDRFLESLNRTINCSEVRFAVNPVNDTPDPAANPTPKKKQKIAGEAD